MTPKQNSIIRKAAFREMQLPVVADVIKHYKSTGYKIQDSAEVVMIVEPNSTFRIFISRVSHNLQMYYLGEYQDTMEICTKDIESAAEVIKLEQEFKQKFG